MFTPQAIKKLEDLKNNLDTLYKRTDFEKNERSEYSRKMVLNAIEICKLLIANNNVNYWSKNSNQKKLKELLDYLDNNKGTYVPDVFNQESMHLAYIFINHLEKIDMAKDLDWSTRAAIKSLIGDPTIFLKLLKDNLYFKKNLYRTFINNQKDADNLRLLSNTISATQIEYENEAKTLTKETYPAFIKKYTEKFSQFTQDIQLLPYVRIANADSFVNAQEPYPFSADKFHARGNRGTLVHQLIHGERFLNKILKQAGLAPVTTIFDHYTTTFSSVKCNEAKSQFEKIIANLQQAGEQYKKGSHLRFKMFRSVNETKATLFDNMLKKIQALTTDSDTPIGISIFEAFKHTLIASTENAMIAKEEEISIGTFSKLVNSYGLQLFALSFSGIDETNDNGIEVPIKQYIREVEKIVSESPVITNTLKFTM